MAKAIESFMERLMAPFADELARMPSSAYRHLFNIF